MKLDGEPLTDCGRIQSFVKPHFYPKQAKDSMDFCMITAKDMQQAIEFPAWCRSWQRCTKAAKPTL